MQENVMSRRFWQVSCAVVAIACWTSPVSAQIVQSLHVSGGFFIPRGYDGRVSDDVLVADLNDLEFRGCETDPIQSCIHRFNSGQVFGEWVVALNNHLEIGAGVGFYSRGVDSYYRDYTFPDGSDITQRLQLRIVPITGVVRVLAGRPGSFQPYVGGGIAALNYHYSETGDFIDFTQLDATGAFVTYPAQYRASGTAVGGLVLAGFRAPLKGDIWAFTTEWRYQAGSADTGGAPNGFLGSRIDLGGNSINFGLLVRF
jgi:hypothetical protein